MSGKGFKILNGMDQFFISCNKMHMVFHYDICIDFNIS